MRFNNIWSYRQIILSKNFLRSVWHSRRNALADKHGRPPVAGPYMAEFDITYRCNCRCQMCQRWNDPRPETLQLKDYERLSRSFAKMAVHQISIAGGEPLVRRDVFEIIRTFSRRGLSVNLCTNGMLVGRYMQEIIASRPTCVTVSLDGATAETHDAIRGIEGSYEQVKKGIHQFLTVPAGKRPILRVRMTISNQNQREIKAFFKKWDGVVDDVLLQPVHHCGDSYYTGLQTNERILDPAVLSAQIKSTPLDRDEYMRGLIQSLQQEGSYPLQRCYAGVLMARIDPWGDVYPCLEQHVKIGSIVDQSFESVWASAPFEDERQRLRNGRQCRCWYNNTAVIGHYGDLLRRTGA